MPSFIFFSITKLSIITVHRRFITTKICCLFGGWISQAIYFVSREDTKILNNANKTDLDLNMHCVYFHRVKRGIFLNFNVESW